MDRRVVLDLTKHHFRRDYGGIIAWGTWHRTEDGWKTCLVLTRSRESGFSYIAPYIIPLNNAYLWTDLSGIGDPVAAARGSYAAAEHLGLNAHSPLQVMRIRSIISDLIGELLLMPPRPPVEQRAVAEVVMREDGRREHHHEINEDV